MLLLLRSIAFQSSFYIDNAAMKELYDTVAGYQPAPYAHNLTEDNLLYNDDPLTSNTGGGSGGSGNAKVIFGGPNEVFGRAVQIINVFGIPCIICCGALGNTMSLIVFLKTHLRKHSSSVYLAFLNIVDTMFLLCLIVTWLGFMDIHLIHIEGWCQAIIFFSYISSFSSVYTVVGFTIERWIVVYYPLKRSTWCSRKRACSVICTIVLVGTLIYTYTIWSFGVNNIGPPVLQLRACLPKPSFFVFVKIMSAMDTVITLIVPSVAIIILNVCITIKIWHFLHRRYFTSPLGEIGPSSIPLNSRRLRTPTDCNNGELETLQAALHVTTSVETSPPASHESSTVASRQISSRHRLQLRTTRSLIIVSTTFVLLNLPSHAFRISAVVLELTNPAFMFSKEALLWQHICQIVYYLNFAMNYFLYCACSKSFRMASQRMWSRVSKTIRDKLMYTLRLRR